MTEIAGRATNPPATTRSDASSSPAARGRAPDDAPNVLAPAPFILLGVLIAGVILDAVLWLGIVAEVPEIPRLAIGLALALIGARIIFQAMDIFRRSGTPFEPYKPSLALATGGIFGRTRNPMYQGMGIVMLGLAFLLRSDWTIVLLLLIAPVIHYGLVRREERYLAARFGQDYARFAKQVPRYAWLVWPAAPDKSIARDWLTWAVAAAAFIVTAYAARYLTDRVIEAREEPGIRTAALARATIADMAGAVAAAAAAGLRRSLDVKVVMDEIRRVDAGSAGIRGWAADVRGGGSPLTVLVFVGGANSATLKTRGARPDVTRALRLPAAAAENVAYEGTVPCRPGQKLIVVATTTNNRYGAIDRLACP